MIFGPHLLRSSSPILFSHVTAVGTNPRVWVESRDPMREYCRPCEFLPKVTTTTERPCRIAGRASERSDELTSDCLLPGPDVTSILSKNITLLLLKK